MPKAPTKSLSRPRNRPCKPRTTPLDTPALTTPQKHGEVAEWSIAPVSKTGVGASLPWVRIPPSPPLSLIIFRYPESFVTWASSLRGAGASANRGAVRSRYGLVQLDSRGRGSTTGKPTACAEGRGCRSGTRPPNCRMEVQRPSDRTPSGRGRSYRTRWRRARNGRSRPAPPRLPRAALTPQPANRGSAPSSGPSQPPCPPRPPRPRPGAASGRNTHFRALSRSFA